MYILLDKNNKQLQVYPDNSARVPPLLRNMADGWMLEYVPTFFPDNPGILLAWGQPIPELGIVHTHITDRGKQILAADGLIK
jgi:hypothetical protein